MINRKVRLDAEDIEFITHLIENGNISIFHIPEFRQHISKKRLKSAEAKISVWKKMDDGVAGGTVDHNMTELTTRGLASIQRTTRLLGPLSSLSPVYEAAHKLKVLTIGPRTEMEIFHLIALGFKPENIQGLDLISYSDYIKLGDMHDIPFDSNTFDVCISSWTIGYSTEPQKVIDEMCRVTKSSGLISIGYTHDHKRESYIDKNQDKAHTAGSGFKTALEVLGLFRNVAHKVHYVQEPVDSKANKMMIILRINK